MAALIRLAGSPDVRDRADAGRGLASFAELPGASRPLLGLVLDADDTFVTRVTAEALLRRQDSTGLAVVATADPNHSDWIHTAVRECEALARDADELTRHGAGELTAMLAAINPILRPARND